MNETYEFRVFEEFVPLISNLNEGIDRSAISRKFVLTPNDPRFKKIEELQKIAIADKSNYNPVFVSWNIERGYSKDELSQAEIFLLKITAVFEPEGEECGTLYDELTACPICGAGAKQTSDLWLNVQHIPKAKDFARSIADEWVVSQSVADIFEGNTISGVELREVHHRGRSRNDLPKWHELLVTSQPISISSRTVVGNSPFDPDEGGEYKCPKGHLLGLNVLSEVYVDRATWDGSDVVCSKQLVGLRQGVLRPKPILLISPRLRAILLAEKIKGIETEVAHLV